MLPDKKHLETRNITNVKTPSYKLKKLFDDLEYT